MRWALHWFARALNVGSLRRVRPILRSLAVIGVVGCGGVTTAYAYSAQLTWLPVQGAAGYVLYIRQNPLPFGVGTDIGPQAADADGRIRFVTADLPLNVTNSFALTAYNQSRVESQLSNELSLRVDATAVPTATLANTPTVTSTRTLPPPPPTATPTRTAVPTVTPTQTAAPTHTPTQTAVPTRTPPQTAAPTHTPTQTAVPTLTPTSTIAPTATLTPTRTLTRTPTNTQVPQATEPPESIANLVLWLDASVLGLNNGAPVASWADRSAAPWVASQGTAGSRPTYYSTAINGRAAVRFDGIDDHLTIVGSLVPGSRDRTVFVVMRPNVIDNKGVLDLGDGSTADGAFMLTPEMGLRINGANRLWRQSAWVGAATIGVLRFQGTDTDDFTTWINGAPLTVASTDLGTVNTVGNTTIGSFTAAPVGYHAFDGDIAELIVYDRALSTAERQTIERYLAGKYDIALAPTTLAGVRLWLDADSIDAADGDAVGAWPDRSALGWIASQGNAALRPTFRVDVGGRSVVNFDGLDDHLIINGTVVAGSANRTVIAVTRPDVIENNSIIDLGDGTVDGSAFMLTPELALRIDGGNRFWQTSLPTQQQSIAVVTSTGSTTAALSAWINGVALSELLTSPSSINTQGAATVGGFTAVPTGYHSFAGDISEIVVYNRALTESERASVEQYLAAKYNIGLGFLPAGSAEWVAGGDRGETPYGLTERSQSRRTTKLSRYGHVAGRRASLPTSPSPTPTATPTPSAE